MKKFRPYIIYILLAIFSFSTFLNAKLKIKGPSKDDKKGNIIDVKDLEKDGWLTNKNIKSTI